MSADSITPGKKPVTYAIIVTTKAYTTATYLIVLSCVLSSKLLNRGNRQRKSSYVHVANEFKFDTVTLEEALRSLTMCAISKSTQHHINNTNHSEPLRSAARKRPRNPGIYDILSLTKKGTMPSILSMTPAFNGSH